MIDIKLIRETPAVLDDALNMRGIEPKSKMILSLDTQYRHLLTELQELLSERNQIAKDFPLYKKNNQDTTALTQRAEVLKKMIPALEEQAQYLKIQIDQCLSEIPNIPLSGVPFGEDESRNVCLKTVGTRRSFDFEPLSHDVLGQQLEMMDFTQAAVVSGARFVYLRKDLARLERALTSFMLDHQTQNYGYCEMVPPYLVQNDAAYGTAQLPKFKEDLFQTTTGHWLISTAEISLTNWVLKKSLDASLLPLRLTACTPCFRSEAGSSGRDTKGMIRLHQFNKVELVSICTPEQTEQEFDHMYQAATSVLEKLELPYRAMQLCTGDMGFASARTIDLEVWIPSQNTYREISSISRCEDFQARRMNARYRSSDGKLNFLHTLNGSGLPTGRTLVAILENYQEKDGRIKIPTCLIPYMNGQTYISRS